MNKITGIIMSQEENEVDEKWEVLPDQVVLETPVVKIRKGPVVCRRNGKKRDFFAFEFPDWVNIIAVAPTGEIVMIRQFRYGSGRVEIEIPGGMINPGEDPVAAGRRELLEETGYTGEGGRIIGRVCPNPAVQGNSCYTVLIENVRKTSDPLFDDMEDIESFLATEEWIRERVASGEIDHGLVLNGLTFFRDAS